MIHQGSWVLIIYIYAGTFAKGDSVALQKISGFSSQQTCEDAAQNISAITNSSLKEFRHACVEVK